MTARYGLSLYPGLDNSEAENRALLQEAHALGYDRIFTSLQILEADRDVLRRQAVTLFQLARDLGFEIMADVSPATVSLFQWPDLTPARITDLGITTVRFDYGIDTATMAAFSRVCRIQCNASTVREEDLQALERAGCDLTRVEGLHNFYPHRYTGLSLDY
ncbi:MAG: MupG family TIM beta-alpha barrel fold protein, partial [Succiniclasticum sp.]